MVKIQLTESNFFPELSTIFSMPFEKSAWLKWMPPGKVQPNPLPVVFNLYNTVVGVIKKYLRLFKSVSRQIYAKGRAF